MYAVAVTLTVFVMLIAILIFIFQFYKPERFGEIIPKVNCLPKESCDELMHNKFGKTLANNDTDNVADWYIMQDLQPNDRRLEVVKDMFAGKHTMPPGDPSCTFARECILPQKKYEVYKIDTSDCTKYKGTATGDGCVFKFDDVNLQMVNNLMDFAQNAGNKKYANDDQRLKLLKEQNEKLQIMLASLSEELRKLYERLIITKLQVNQHTQNKNRLVRDYNNLEVSWKQAIEIRQDLLRSSEELQAKFMKIVEWEQTAPLGEPVQVIGNHNIDNFNPKAKWIWAPPQDPDSMYFMKNVRLYFNRYFFNRKKDSIVVTLEVYTSTPGQVTILTKQRITYLLAIRANIKESFQIQLEPGNNLISVMASFENNGNVPTTGVLVSLDTGGIIAIESDATWTCTTLAPRHNTIAYSLVLAIENSS
jgi:hypothetical protein